MAVRRGANDVFVGRAAELDVLHGALAEARAGTSRVVWIEGDAGAGKTTLIRRFLADTHANSETGLVVSASGDDSEEGLPFGVLQQLARALPSDCLTGTSL